ncbi:hypothetical protein ACOMHN_056645 [Nucella lapillus]
MLCFTANTGRGAEAEIAGVGHRVCGASHPGRRLTRHSRLAGIRLGRKSGLVPPPWSVGGLLFPGFIGLWEDYFSLASLAEDKGRLRQGTSGQSSAAPLSLIAAPLSLSRRKGSLQAGGKAPFRQEERLPSGRRKGSLQAGGKAPFRQEERLPSGRRKGSLQAGGKAPFRQEERLPSGRRKGSLQAGGKAPFRQEERLPSGRRKGS